MSSSTDNPSWIERGWSLWIHTILRLPRTVLLFVAILAAAGGAYAASGHPRFAAVLTFLGAPKPGEAVATPTYRREIVLHAALLEGYDPVGLADAVDDAVRGFAADGELFEAVEAEYVRDPATRGDDRASGNGPSEDAVRRAEERIAFWCDLPTDADGTASPGTIWRRLAERGDASPMHALEADGLLYATAQRVSRPAEVERDDEALGQLGEAFDAFWSLSTAISPGAVEARVFVRLTAAATEDRERGTLAHAKLCERIDAARMRWPSVEWTPSGPGYATLVEAAQPQGPTWWDLTTLLGAAGLAASAAGNLRRFGVAMIAAVASGLSGYALATGADLEGLVSASALALSLSVWTALAGTLLLSSLASCLEREAAPKHALATTFAGAGTACLLPLLSASTVYAIGGAGDVPGAAALFGVVGAWTLISIAFWAAFLPAALWSLRRYGALDRVGFAERRPSVIPRRRPGGGFASSVAPLTFAASIFVAWGAIHLEPRGDASHRSFDGSERRERAPVGPFALCRADSAAELAEIRSRLDGLGVVATTLAKTREEGPGEWSPLDDRLARVERIAQSLPRSVPFAGRPDWSAFAEELRGETSAAASGATTPQRRRLAEATMQRLAKMRPGDVDRALGLCFRAWLARRDREVAAISAFASGRAIGPDGAQEAAAGSGRWATADGAPLLWIFPKPGVDAREFALALRGSEVQIGGPAAEFAVRAEQRRRFAVQVAIFTLGVAGAALMIVLQSFRDTAATLWAGGCSLAQTAGIAGWLGIPWHEEWIGTAPLAASAWLATTLAHRLRPARGGDVWTGAPFATLAASVAAMAVALRWMGGGDDATLAAASWWAILLAAGWWNAWAFCGRSAAAELAEEEALDDARSLRAADAFDLAEAPTHPLERAPRRTVLRLDDDRDARRSFAAELEPVGAESRSFSSWDEPTQPLIPALSDEELTAAFEDYRRAEEVRGADEAFAADLPALSQAFVRRDESAPHVAGEPKLVGERMAASQPRRRVLAAEPATDDAWLSTTPPLDATPRRVRRRLTE